MFLENQENVYFISNKKHIVLWYISYSEEKITKLYNFNNELCIKG